MQIKKTKVVLQYTNDYDCPEYWDEEYMPFVDLDTSSGGYPYPVDIYRAHNFKTIEKAKAYIGADPLTVRVVTINYDVN